MNLVVTEYGVANLNGLFVRDRARTLIDLAHSDDRSKLVDQAKQEKSLYQDQIFLPERGNLYQFDINANRRA